MVQLTTVVQAAERETDTDLRLEFGGVRGQVQSSYVGGEPEESIASQTLAIAATRLYTTAHGLHLFRPRPTARHGPEFRN